MSASQQKLIEMTVRASNIQSIAESEGLQAQALREHAEKYGVKNMIYPDNVLKALRKAWAEVGSEVSAKDPLFKKVWEDIKGFMAEYDVWECHSLQALPQPECK